jgi:hypothetical protein
MTHTLHRKGTVENLSNDFVVFAITAQSVNAKGTAPAFAEFAEIVVKYNPVNYGDMKTGNIFNTSKDVLFSSTKDNSIFHAVFTDETTVAKVLAELKERDLGLSIVVSGLTDHTTTCCQEAGLKLHSMNKSLGIWGATDRLPADDVVQVTTMCGHGMVAFGLVEDLAERVSKGMDAMKASKEMAKLCHCGVFNTDRGASILEKMAAEINKK